MALLFGAALTAAGCDAEREAPSPEGALYASFPAQAGAVLGAYLRAEEGLPVGAAAEASRPPGGAEASVARGGEFTQLEVELPREGEGALRLEAPGGFEASVREVGARGASFTVEHAVAYRREGGTSFWTRAPGGAEEWLHLSASAVREGVAVAAWEVTGARLEPRGQAIALVDDQGRARAWVSAPAAFGAGGRKVRAQLAAIGARLELFVEAAGEEVLVDPQWTLLPPMSEQRNSAAMVLLDDGRALMIGGDHNEATATVEAYDWHKNTWELLAPMNSPRVFARAEKLLDGRVMVTGGCDHVNGKKCFESAEIYDPVKKTWTLTAPMSDVRRGHTMTLLKSGRVLVVGGAKANLGSAEIYDPTQGNWTKAPSFGAQDDEHVAARLSDGRVLVASSDTNTGAQIYDPDTNAWKSVARMKVVRANATLTLLTNGKVLLAGGYDQGQGDAFAHAEIYDPASDTWSELISMPSPHAHHTATRLFDGRVFLAGGVVAEGGAVSKDAVLLDPASASFADQPKMMEARASHMAVLLDSGEVLLAGGHAGGPHLDSAELFTPATGGACGKDADCAGGFCVVGACCLTPCDAPCFTCDGAHDTARVGVCSFRQDDETCDDRNACTKASACKQGICQGTDPVVCPAKDACHLAACNPVKGDCLSAPKKDGTKCDDHDPCTHGDACHAGRCTGSGSSDSMCSAAEPVSLALGELCNDVEQCASGFCVDGICCESACEEECHSCALPEHRGHCAVEPAGVDLRRDCALEPDCLSTCGPEGTCTDAGKGAQCLPAECVDDRHSLAKVLCASAGASCASDDRALVDCYPARCDAFTGECRKGCRTIEDCAPGAVCGADYTCVERPPVANGSDAGCQLAPSGPGGPASLGGVGCALSAWLLGLLGARRLASRVRRAKRARREQPPRQETGLTLLIVALFAVGSLGCSVDPEAVPAIAPPVARTLGTGGQACAQDAECMSDACLDGICCNSACPAGACRTCAKAKGASADGVCGIVADGADCDNPSKCTKQSSCMAGVCVGHVPVYCPSSDPCVDAFCQPEDGSCATRPRAEGAPCDDGNPCTLEEKCHEGACVSDATKSASGACGENSRSPSSAGSLGSPCASADGCINGLCVDGVCCDTACDAPCHSCAYPGHVGTCFAEELGVDLRNDCAKLDCISTCDGKGGCVDSGPGTTCASSACDGDHQSLAPVKCTGRGEGCPLTAPRLIADCTPYGCEGVTGMCRVGCRSVNDCAPGYACNAAGRCALPPDQRAGDDGCSAAPGRLLGGTGAVRGSSRPLTLGAAVLMLALAARRRSLKRSS